MIYTGDAAIEFLSSHIGYDPKASSHWQKFHSNFNFNGNEFSGLEGFGNNSKPFVGILHFLHRSFQKKFRKMGQGFAECADIDKTAEKLTLHQRRAYDLDALRQSITLGFLKAKIPEKLNSDKITLVIGDGFGFMTALLLANNFAGTVILINLNKTLLVDIWYLKMFFGEEFNNALELITDESDIEALNSKSAGLGTKGRVIALQAENHHLLRYLKPDIAINIASMQEMDPVVIEEYFNDLRQISPNGELTFYCCNREEKSIPDGTIIRFKDYPWRSTDTILVDELCPWHRQYYELSPPFYKSYDGEHIHQLRVLKNEP